VEVKRWGRFVKEEVLSRLIVFEERALRHAPPKYVAHLHQERLHQGKGNVVLKLVASHGQPHDGPIRCREQPGDCSSITTARSPARWFQAGEHTMSHPTSPIEQITAPDAHAWVHDLPDGAISVDIEDATLVLRASQKLQERLEILLDKRKAGTLSPEEQREYAAICDLDTTLSWLNRLARGAQ